MSLSVPIATLNPIYFKYKARVASGNRDKEVLETLQKKIISLNDQLGMHDCVFPIKLIHKMKKLSEELESYIKPLQTFTKVSRLKP